MRPDGKQMSQQRPRATPCPKAASGAPAWSSSDAVVGFQSGHQLGKLRQIGWAAAKRAVKYVVLRATGRQIIEVPFNRLVDEEAGGKLSFEDGPCPRHRLVDVGVLGSGHQELSRAANSLVDFCLLPPMIRVRLAGSRPSIEPKVTIWRIASLAAVSAGFFKGPPVAPATTMP